MTLEPRRPAGWSQKTLRDCCSLIVDGTHYTPTYVEHGIPFYSVENVTSDDFVHVKQISTDEHRRLTRRCRPQRGDILMTRIGSLAETKYLDWDVNASIYVSLALLRPRPDIDARYLYAYTKTQRFVRVVEDRSLLWAAPKKINMGDLGSVPIRLPTSLESQRAIADVLFTLDDQLLALQRLVSKKTAVMEGLMQHLLSGRSRLPGFITPWHRATVDDLAVIVSGGTPKSSDSSYWNGDIPWCTPTDITQQSGRYLTSTARTISREGLKCSAAQLLPAGSVLLCTRATIGVAKVAAAPTATNQGFKSLVPRPQVSSGYLYYRILSLKNDLAVRGTGSTFLEVSKKDVASLSFESPGYEEQVAIAAVLSDADDEIASLHRQLVKARSLRTGILYRLLDGETPL